MSAPTSERALVALAAELNAVQSQIAYVPGVLSPFPVCASADEAFQAFVTYYQSLAATVSSLTSSALPRQYVALQQDYASLAKKHKETVQTT